MTPDCEYTVINLTENHEYEFRIMAVNAAGKSDPSSMTMPVKVTETPGKYIYQKIFNLLSLFIRKISLIRIFLICLQQN